MIQEGFPVSPGHTLIISKQLHKDYLELTPDEKIDIDNTILQAKSLIEAEFTRDGYNIGMTFG